MKPGIRFVWKTDRLVREVYFWPEKTVSRDRRKRARFETIRTSERWARNRRTINWSRILTRFDQYIREIGNYRTSLSMRRHQKNDRAMSAYPPYGKRRAADRPGDEGRCRDDAKTMKTTPRKWAIGRAILQESRRRIEATRDRRPRNRDGYLPPRTLYLWSVSASRAASETRR